MIQHLVGKKNQVANALSERVIVLTILQSMVVGFDELKELYAIDPNFGKAWKEA